MKILKFALGQLLRTVLLLLGVSALTFALVSASPLDPVKTNVGQAALGSMSPRQIEKLERYWGVGQPAPQRYLAWVFDFVRGDMGVSLKYRQNVSEILGERLKSSLWLMAMAWVISGLLGFLLGVVSGARQGSWLDKIIYGYSLLIASTPVFWLALLLLIVFGVWLGVLPIGFSMPVGAEAMAVTLADRLRHALLPALTLSITGVAGIALHTRAKMLEVMQSDYALFAAARGQGRWGIALRHGLRNVLLPALTLQFAQIGEIFGGSVLVEQVFSYPGIGQAAVQAGLGSDIPLLMGITVISAAIVFLGNFTANMLYGIIDPRMRREGMKR